MLKPGDVCLIDYSRFGTTDDDFEYEANTFKEYSTALTYAKVFVRDLQNQMCEVVETIAGSCIVYVFSLQKNVVVLSTELNVVNLTTENTP